MPSPSSLAFTTLMRLSRRKRRLSHAESLHRSLDRAHRSGRDIGIPPRRLARHAILTPEYRHGWLCWRVVPRAPHTRGGHLLYLHGGAYVAQISAVQWRAVTRIATAAGAHVTVPVYPLAPASTAEQTVATATDITAGLLAESGAAGFTVLGDSAGGGLALAVAQQLRERETPQPRRLILLGPWLDLTMSDPLARELAARDAMLDVPGLREAARMYAGALPATDPRVSPLFGNLTALAPISMFSGTADLLHADALAMLDRAARCGSRIDYHECRGGQHCYPLLPTREGARARERIIELLKN